MIFPIDIHFGAVIIPSHLIFDILAFYVSIEYFTYLSRKYQDPLPENRRWFLILAAAVGALLGSRLLAALERPAILFTHPTFFFLYGNKTIAGGLIGGILGVELVKKILREKKASGDLLTYPLILGIMVGRIGCFLTGVKDGTVGVASNLPWAFDQGDGIPRHPTALYEILFLGILWIVLKKIQKKYILKNGTLFRLFIVSYLVFRFFVEFIKPVNPLLLGLSSIQLASLAVAVYYLIRYTIYNYGITKST